MRILILVEGRSEELFIRDVLLPHFRPRGIELIPTLLTTKRILSGPSHKGGVGAEHFKRDMRRLLNDTAAAMITMMFDLHGLPQNFPGMDALHTERDYRERVAALVQSLQGHFPDRRFLPYFSTHEFEALILHFPEHIAGIMGRQVKDVSAFALDAEAESVNHDNPPAKRIAQIFQGYRKAFHGPMVAKQLGLAAIRSHCPIFHAWIEAMESLG